jgi:hypothetical protein
MFIINFILKIIKLFEIVKAIFYLSFELRQNGDVSYKIKKYIYIKYNIS